MTFSNHRANVLCTHVRTRHFGPPSNYPDLYRYIIYDDVLFPSLVPDVHVSTPGSAGQHPNRANCRQLVTYTVYTTADYNRRPY